MKLHHKLSKIINDNFKQIDSKDGKYGNMRNFQSILKYYVDLVLMVMK